jgi:hypothetical protein
MKQLLLPLAIAVASFASPPHAEASLVRAMDLAELTATAEQIVVADVAKVESRWDKDHRTIFSTIELRVQESWKGPPPADGRMVLRQPGGSVGEIEMTVVGMPSFSAGERALLFLDGAGVVGMAQGKRRLRWDEAGKRWLAGPGDASSAVHIDQRGQIHAAPASPAETLDDLRAKVRALLEKQR